LEYVACGQLRRGYGCPYIAPAAIDKYRLRYDGVMDADVGNSVARCRLLRKPDVLFASLKALDAA
jgi:hypothetical protein